MVCTDVSKEPKLSTTPNSNEEIQGYISVLNFWQRLQRAFVNVRVFFHITSIYQNQLL